MFGLSLRSCFHTARVGAPSLRRATAAPVQPRPGLGTSRPKPYQRCRPRGQHSCKRASPFSTGRSSVSVRSMAASPGESHGVVFRQLFDAQFGSSTYTCTSPMAGTRPCLHPLERPFFPAGGPVYRAVEIITNAFTSVGELTGCMST
jgi:hypothetical protein